VITVSRHGAVAVVTLVRPEARNALTGPMMRGLATAIHELDLDDTVRAIILTGTDPAFCAGLDLKDLKNTYDDIELGPETGIVQRGLLPECSTPIIAAINGPAVTGGLELALGCDWMIASREHATFADTHARVGVMPGGGMTIRLPQLIGINRARQMSFTGNFIDAATAFEWGLVNEICTHDALMATAMLQAEAIAASDPKVRSAGPALARRGPSRGVPLEPSLDDGTVRRSVLRHESAWHHRQGQRRAIGRKSGVARRRLGSDTHLGVGKFRPSTRSPVSDRGPD
jgi:enoyl-CoA hydratase